MQWVLPIIFLVQYNRESTVLKNGVMIKCSGGYPNQYILFYPLSALVSCSWALWNSEARHFIYRKAAAACTSLLTRRPRKVGPLEYRAAERNLKIAKKVAPSVDAKETKAIMTEEFDIGNTNDREAKETDLQSLTEVVDTDSVISGNIVSLTSRNANGDSSNSTEDKNIENYKERLQLRDIETSKISSLYRENVEEKESKDTMERKSVKLKKENNLFQEGYVDTVDDDFESYTDMYSCEMCDFSEQTEGGLKVHKRIKHSSYFFQRPCDFHQP